MIECISQNKNIQTIIKRVDPFNPEKNIDAIKRAASIIINGGLVAFPTETVYGLGGDALNEKTVAQIYAAKGRPGDNPLILHVANADDFWRLSSLAPKYAKLLIDAFWPGPLTLVANKNPDLPSWVGVHPNNQAGTVAIRMPSHPIALELIRESGCCIAAPSANKSGRPSPTSFTHVADDFPDSKELGIIILDGGLTTVGLESTVVDITGENPVVLRPGSITQAEIERVVNLQTLSGTPIKSDSPRSPGTKYRHYAPKAPLTILVGKQSDIADFLANEASKPIVGALITPNTYELLPEDIRINAKIIVTGPQVEHLAKNLYSNLRAFDNLEVDRIFAECAPFEGIGIAVMDRMQKAAEGRIIIV